MEWLVWNEDVAEVVCGSSVSGWAATPARSVWADAPAARLSASRAGTTNRVLSRITNPPGPAAPWLQECRKRQTTGSVLRSCSAPNAAFLLRMIMQISGSGGRQRSARDNAGTEREPAA